MRYGIKMYLKQTKQLDIDANPSFQSSNEVYKAMLVKLVKGGLGNTEHKEPISKEDMEKLYSHRYAFNITTPVGLQNKVFFEIMLYLCRRGRENLHSQTKNTFAVKTDSTGREYVFQIVSEMDKNHRVDSVPNDTTGEGRMYALPGNILCPVASFQLYLSKLHPNCEALWQRPLNSFDETCAIWYYKSLLGN